jgi:aminopeptidase YwaD
MNKRLYPTALAATVCAALITFYLHSFVGAVPRIPRAADAIRDLSASRYLEHVKYLASDALKGRGDGTPELDKAADYIASQFRLWGLRPMGDNNSYFQNFEITTGAQVGPKTAVELNGNTLKLNEDFVAIPFSSAADVEAPLIFAGYGITAPELHYDDYDGIDAKDSIVVVVRHQPQEMDPKSAFASTPHASFVNKAINAKQHGARAIIFITGLNHQDEEVGKATSGAGTDDLGIPAIHAKRDLVLKLLSDAKKDLAAIKKKIDTDLHPQSFALPVRAHISTDVIRTRKTVKNVVAAVTGSDSMLQNEWVVVGAHYDHLGLGDQHSLAPSQIGQIHHGADDNASGTAGMLEIARLAARNKHEWKRSVLFMAFAGEELGLFGSAYFTNHPTIPLNNTMAMINMDMIGRLNNNRLFIGGVGTAAEFKPDLEELNKAIKLQLDYSDSGYGASDHMSFNTKKIPVLFIFSGLHTDYHKPSDTADKINADGAVRILSLVYLMLDKVATDVNRLEYVEVQQPSEPRGGSGTGYGPYFGSVPDFRDDLKGVLFADVQNNSPAAKAGLKAGDLLVQFDGKPIENLYDFTYALRSKKPGDMVQVVVKRNGQDVKADVLLEARR